MAEHICPWWLGYVLASPLRRVSQKPERILSPYVGRGMTAVDIGCGMGYFSLPLARMVGHEGRVVCVDLQPRMIESVRRRVARAGLSERMDLRVCSRNHLNVDDLTGTVDFVLAFAVAHEVPDVPGFMTQIRVLLNAKGRCLLAEPTMHVRAAQFADTVAVAETAGLTVVEHPQIRRSRAVLLGVNATPTTLQPV